MSGAPFRERLLSGDEVQQIVRRAANLTALAGTNSESMTEWQLRERLSALGISSDVARRAIDGTRERVPATPGGILRVVGELTLEGALSPARHEDIADAISHAMKMEGRVSVVGNRLTWMPSDLRSEPAVTVHAMPATGRRRSAASRRLRTAAYKWERCAHRSRPRPERRPPMMPRRPGALVAEKCVTNAGVCCAQSGLLFDEARGCVSTTRKTIGCAPRPIPADSACIDLGIIGCAITHDGGVRRVWKTTSQAAGWSPAEGCSTELREKVLMASACADAGG